MHGYQPVSVYEVVRGNSLIILDSASLYEIALSSFKWLFTYNYTGFFRDESNDFLGLLNISPRTLLHHILPSCCDVLPGPTVSPLQVHALRPQSLFLWCTDAPVLTVFPFSSSFRRCHQRSSRHKKRRSHTGMSSEQQRAWKRSHHRRNRRLSVSLRAVFNWSTDGLTSVWIQLQPSLTECTWCI